MHRRQEETSVWSTCWQSELFRLCLQLLSLLLLPLLHTQRPGPHGCVRRQLGTKRIVLVSCWWCGPAASNFAVQLVAEPWTALAADDPGTTPPRYAVDRA